MTSNSIHLEKGKWPKHGKIESFTRYKFNRREIKTNYFSTIEPLAENIKTLKSFEIYSVNTLKPSDHENIIKFKNLEQLQLCLPYIDEFPEFLFKSLPKLKDLSLLLKGGTELNGNHFEGLVNLQRIYLSIDKNGSGRLVLNNCFDSLAELKELKLNGVFLNQSSVSGFENVQILKLGDFTFKKTETNLFQNMKNLKFLELSKVSCIEMLSSVPTTVETLKTYCHLIEPIDWKSRSIPFIRELKSLDIEFNRRVVFDFDLSKNLESLIIKRCSRPTAQWSTVRGPPFVHVSKLKTLSYLKSVTFQGIVLNGIDAEFNYLIEASFSRQMPQNLIHFYNLEKLCLEKFDQKISLGEPFLEHLTNLEELRLDTVFDSIDSNAQCLFKGLVKLKTQRITNNMMAEVKSTYFGHLVNLEELTLTKNKTKTIQFDSFRSLSNLKFLDLSDNFLKEIRKKKFSKNKKLEKVILKNSIKPQTISPL